MYKHANALTVVLEYFILELLVSENSDDNV